MQLLLNTKITFIGRGRERIAAILSSILILGSLASIVLQGFNLAIDFTGGVLAELSYERPVQIAEIRKVLEESEFSGAIVQNIGSDREIMVRLPVQQASDDEISSRLRALLPGAEPRRIEFVGPQVGEDLRDDGGLAMLYAIFGILIYVMVRFSWKFSLGAIGATLHDVIITFGFFSISRLPFDLPALASVLAVIGYSLNDTVVIFDRVRENLRKLRTGTVVDAFNISINETLSRTFITAGTVLLVVLVLFFFGGDMLHSFSAALLVGAISGTYSTLYIASPITLYFGVAKKDVMPVTKEAAADPDRP
ncbi:MAG: protein translocase subunit SecF [Gammaproteobacteria bacterium]|nr:protein translocase subunit SecF [Gammaproteobacteria bacterium]